MTEKGCSVGMVRGAFAGSACRSGALARLQGDRRRGEAWPGRSLLEAVPQACDSTALRVAAGEQVPSWEQQRIAQS